MGLPVGISGLRLLVCLVVASAAGVSASGCGPSSTPRGDRAAAPAVHQDGSVASNILRADYVGSRACAACHRDIYRTWEASPMHLMTRVPETSETRAPFDGRTFRFKEDSLTLTRRGSERFVAISSRSFGDHVFRITRIIGGRYREDFAGVEVAEARQGSARMVHTNDELILPVTFVYSPPSFRLKGYSVMVAERPGLRAGGVWNQTCILCHNAAPYFSSLFGELAGPGAPSYQGELVDRLLPRERRASISVVASGALIGAAVDELRFLGSGETPEDVRSAMGAVIRTTRTGFAASHLVEVGIACESCHGGSREHASEPRRKPSFEIRSSFLRVRASPWEEANHAPVRTRAINRACARCHQVLFSRYPFTWEGGRRNGDPGGSHISSGEGRDFLLGGCSSAMSCVACHDPHAADSREKLLALETPAGNALCLGCHAKLDGRDAERAHSHHDPQGAGGACIACHMAKKNMGLGYGLTRYHRIGSPTEKGRVERDRPLECALCHVDKTVADLVESMERFWGKKYDRAALVSLYGDLNASPLLATLERGKAHEQATAMYVLGERRVAEALGPVAAQLVNRYPLVRYFARDALGKIAGRACDVNLDQDDDEIQSALTSWLAEVGRDSQARRLR